MGACHTRLDFPPGGTCRARITDVEGDMRRNFALERSEVDEGYVLTCQTYPVSEALTVDYDS
ncbi:2Fe-2S iron-sulfur cluster-binding protein [Streptomyces sp. NPDC003016]